jgi:hypothetical protein
MVSPVRVFLYVVCCDCRGKGQKLVPVLLIINVQYTVMQHITGGEGEGGGLACEGSYLCHIYTSIDIYHVVIFIA